MKRPMLWSDQDDDSASDASSSSSSHSDSEAGDGNDKAKGRVSVKHTEKKSEGKSGRHKTGALDFEALRRHGYRGGPSVLSVPVPQEDVEPDWTWSTGKDHETKEVEESYEERQKTRAAILEGEQLATAQTRKEKKNLSFAQKEKRKRDFGQASRGKNYVEEEKRQLRDSGVYSGFDT